MENLPRTMEDNLAPDHQSATNTNFLEERTQISEQAKHDVSMTLPQSVEASMPEDHWMARQQLMKPVLVSQVEWTTAQARNDQITAFNFPGVLSTVESVVKRTLSMYAFYKLSPVVRLQVNATQFHQGQLILSFDPFGQALDADTAPTVSNLLPLADIYYSTGLPNVKVMASEVDPIELKIPFIHPRSFLTSNTIDGFDNMGRVRLQVLNPLRAADGASSSLAVTIWVYAQDASVHVPMNYHEPLLPTMNAIPSIGLESVLDDVVNGGKNVGRMIGNAATGNWGKFLRNGQGLIDNLGSLLGFDYPTRPLGPDKTITPVENLAISVGASRSQRLCLDPVSGYIPDPQVFGTTSDDLDLMRIAKTPVLVAQLSWTASQAVGTQLMQIPVTPVLAPLNFADAAANISYLAYASSLFNYWRGGITFDIEFVATHFHSGRLVAAFVPNLDDTSLTYLNATSSLPNIILDLQQTSKLSFTVPFVSATPLKYVSLVQTLNDEAIIGNLGIFVMNKLAAAANVAPNVEINIYIRAADDFQLFVPANPGYSYRRLAPAEPSIGGIDIQSNRTKDTGQTPVSVLSLGSGHAPNELRFGEDYSLVDLIRRFNFLQRFTLTVDTSSDPFNMTNAIDYTERELLVSPTLEASDPGTVANAQYRTMLGNLSRIFSVWSGSIRYKDVTTASRTSDLLYGITHFPTWYPIDNTGLPYHSQGYAFVTTNLSQDNAIEYEVPYYSPYQCLMTKYPSETDSAPLRVCANGVVLATLYGTTTSVQTTVGVYRYHAGGDDFKFAYLRPPGASFFNGADYSGRLIAHAYVL